MILLDSNVLIALADRRERLHARAVADLTRLLRRDLRLVAPVLTEVCFALPQAHHRARVRGLIRQLEIGVLEIEDEGSLWSEVFDWVARYADHQPDWADAVLAVLCGRDRALRLWTYDREFRDVWRRPDGTRIPLTVQPR